MTAFSDVISQNTALPDTAGLAQAAPVPNAPAMDGHIVLIRLGQKLTGAALVLAAMGLWVQPGAMLDADVLLMKFALSLVMGFAGLAVFQAGLPMPGGAPEVEPEVEIDTVRQEIRSVQGKGARRVVLDRTRMSDLGAAEQTDAGFLLWSAEGALIAEVTLTDANAQASLTTALRCAGKL